MRFATPWLAATLIDDEQLLAPKPDVNYKDLPGQPSPQDFLVLTRVNKITSVGQLCTTSGLGREKTLAAIEVLLDVGLLHIVDANGRPLAPTTNKGDASQTQPVADPIAPLRRERRRTPQASEAVVRSEPAVPVSEPAAQPQSEAPKPEVPVAPPKPEPEPEQPAASDQIAAPNDQTYVMSADVAFALVNDEPNAEFEIEPLAFEPESSPLTPESEAIAIPPPDDMSEEDLFEIDHQPVAFAIEDMIVPTSAAPTPPQPTLDADAAERATPVVSSFDTLATDDEGDDLFMPDSPAHIDRVTGKAPVKRDRAKQAVASAKPAAAKAAAAPPRVSDSNAATYRLFPADFMAYESKYDTVAALDPSMQHEIDFVFDHLEYVDFYQLFGVDRSADRKEIRSSYFEMSKRFHPDKFFRDELGDVASRVDAIFRFVTKGYQTLSKKDKRAEYDRALDHARSAAAQESADDDRKRAMAADMLERRAAQLEQQGQLAQAAAEYKKVASLRRDAHGFVKAASLLLRANQQLDEAASLARAAVRQLPLEVEPRLVLGQIYEKNQMLAEAAKVFGEAEAIAPGDPSVRVHLERVRSQI